MSDVTISEPPLWMQADAYPARLDRRLLDAIWPSELLVRGLGVAQRAAGANLSVDVGPGLAAVVGDDQANQGKYLVGLPALTNVPTKPVPTGAGQKRRDLLVIKINDPDAGGPSGSNGVLRWVEGTPTTGTPATPAVPVSSMPLAYVELANASAAVTNAMIFDQAPRPPTPFVGAAAMAVASGELPLPANTWSKVCEVTVPAPVGSQMLIIAAMSHKSHTGIMNCNTGIYIDGANRAQQPFTTPGTNLYNTGTVPFVFTTTAASHLYQGYIHSDAGGYAGAGSRLTVARVV